MERAVRVGLLLLAFTPALAAACLVAGHAVDVPVAEDWARAALLEPGVEPGVEPGLEPGVAVSDFAIHGALPRLTARANARWFGGDLTLEMALGFGMLLAAALCVYGLLGRTYPDDIGALYGTAFVANLLLFSPIQWENFLWAARGWSFLPLAVLCGGLLVAGSRWPTGRRLASGVSLAAVAVASVPVSTLLAPSGERAGLDSLLSVLGSPFARTTLLPAEDLAPALGVLVAAFFATGAAFCTAARGDPTLRMRAVPWLALGGFSLVACALTEVGADGRDALLSRHASPALYVCLAAVPLFGLAAADLRRRIPASRSSLRSTLAWAPAFAGGVLVVAAGLGWLAGLQGMREWKSARLQARTSLVFLERFAPAHLVRLGGTATLHELRRAARALDGRNQLRPALAGGAGLGPFVLDAPLAAEWGDIESVRATADGLNLAGFAWLAESGRRADGVLVTVRIADGSRQVIALAELHPMPLPPIPEHDHVYNHARIPGIDERATWRVHVPLRGLPRVPRMRVEAFAADSDSLQLHRLTHEVVLRRTAGGLRTERTRSDAP